MRAAGQVRDLGWDASVDAYNAACSLALCLPVLQQDEHETNEERDKALQFYGIEAMKMLKNAVAKLLVELEQEKPTPHTLNCAHRASFNMVRSHFRAR